MAKRAGPEEVAQQLASRLRQLRDQRQLKQSDVAAAAGISRQHYHLLESGLAASGGPANPRLSTLTALADTFDVTVVDLLK